MVTSGNVINIAKDRLNLNFFRLLSIDVLFVRLFYVSLYAYRTGVTQNFPGQNGVANGQSLGSAVLNEGTLS